MDIFKIANKYSNNDNNSLLTIVKEILHYEILDSLILHNELSRSLVFQGGTALRLCYNSNRYSEDLDFVLSEDLDFNPQIMQNFKEIFIDKIRKKYNLEAEIVEPEQSNTLVQRWSAKIFLPLHNRKSVINIEIAKIKSYDNAFKIINSNYNEIIFQKQVKVESLEEILADKIIAFANRNYLKYRDLWDLKLLFDKNVKINFDFINNKINDYKVENFNNKINNKLTKLSENETRSGFYTEMQRFLNKESFNSIVTNDFYQDIVKTIKKEIIVTQKEAEYQENDKKIEDFFDKLKKPKMRYRKK